MTSKLSLRHPLNQPFSLQDTPFSPEEFPKRVEGRDNLMQHYTAWIEISGGANFTEELVFYPMADPTMVFAEWRGVVEIIPTRRLYEQHYGGLFHIVDGKIILFRKYFNPNPMAGFCCLG